MADEMRVGIIGLDTSHSLAFAGVINKAKPDSPFAGMRVTLAYTYGSLDIPSSTNRYPQYIERIEKMGVKVVDTLPELLANTDVILLETNDGRRHLEQAIEVFKAGKRVFIDKPIAASLTDAIAINRASKKYGVPFFSCSSLRYNPKVLQARAGDFGKIQGADVYSLSSREPTHSPLFWYGIHGVEQLFTVMGRGCDTVTCIKAPSVEMVVGTWKDGRIATMRGIRGGYGKGISFGCEVFTEKEGRLALGGSAGYNLMLVEVAKFFRTGEVPIDPEETIELCAFMQAAEESEKLGGIPVKIADVMAKAEQEAAQKVP